MSNRRLAAIGSFLVCLLAPLVPMSASASPGSFPPLVARAFPDGLPAGTTIVDVDTVSFAAGAAVADLAPTDGVCPSGYVCLWANASYTGRRVAFSACDTNGDGVCDWVNLILFTFNDAMTSWKNAKAVDAKWSVNAGGGGTQRCMNAGSQNPQLAASYDNQASAVKIFTTSTAC